ncbi:MAG TPA: Glu/Leu/Phe/Val dehydrogenase dimerization domain-containing protein [Solirubrobacteraceae bacterium]|nr:Glu/Leu/Phe/Val dehydrogenase dimerization domain-containing protein [Solirubrobacteraceae bacterium]
MVDFWKSEQLVICRDEGVGLRAAIAVDDTTRGPGLGGIRMRAYPSDGDAIVEAQRLAAAMTLKNAFAELPFGGAKSVILAPDPGVDRSELMRRFGEFIGRTGGAYLPGVDMGTSPADLALIADTGTEVSCSDEDPSPWTALGVACAVKAAVEQVDRRSGIEGISVVIQGAGHVGAALARDLSSAGAHVSLADVDGDRAAAVAEAVGGRVVHAEDALIAPCDVFAPCAVARVVSQTSIPRLQCRIIAGAANDTLADPADADGLAARGITYVPDFVVNAGGVIHIHAVRSAYDEERLRAEVERIGDRVHCLLADSDRVGITPCALAEHIARATVENARAGEFTGVGA